MKNYSMCGKVLAVLRIALGLAMIYAGVSKFGADAGMISFIGGSAEAMGITAGSATLWFWLATIGEILAGIFLVMGCKGTKIGSFMTAVIMIFALNATGWAEPKARIYFVVAMLLLVLGSNARSLCGKSCGCKSGGCCDSSKGSCSTGSCSTDAGKEVVEA